MWISTVSFKLFPINNLHSNNGIAVSLRRSVWENKHKKHNISTGAMSSLVICLAFFSFNTNGWNKEKKICGIVFFSSLCMVLGVLFTVCLTLCACACVCVFSCSFAFKLCHVRIPLFLTRTHSSIFVLSFVYFIYLNGGWLFFRGRVFFYHNNLIAPRTNIAYKYVHTTHDTMFLCTF